MPWYGDSGLSILASTITCQVKILAPILPENTRKLVAILVYYDGFSAKIWVKYYPVSILRPYLESLIKAILLVRQHETRIEILICWLPLVSIFKILYLVREQKKKRFYGEK